MKKLIIIVILVSSALLLGIHIFHLHELHATYIDRTIKQYTGIQHYDIRKKASSDYDWYADITIGTQDGAALLKRYPFQYEFSKSALNGRADVAQLRSCSTCWYYLDSHGQGPYGYRLFILHKDMSELEMYELFGD